MKRSLTDLREKARSSCAIKVGLRRGKEHSQEWLGYGGKAHKQGWVWYWAEGARHGRRPLQIRGAGQ